MPIIEIKEHGRTFRRRDQEILEFAQDMRANHVAFIRREHVAIRTFVDEDVEVIHPKVGHHFVELAFAVDSAQELRLRELSLHN